MTSGSYPSGTQQVVEWLLMLAHFEHAGRESMLEHMHVWTCVCACLFSWDALIFALPCLFRPGFGFPVVWDIQPLGFILGH